MTQSQVATLAASVGTVMAVRGSVIDIRFDGALPPTHTLLRAGREDQMAIEVLAQHDARYVRGIALTPTQGLARGMPVHNSGGPLQAPVGKPILAHMFDIFGNTVDREPALTAVQWRSVHSQPPPLVRRSSQSEVFETAIKAIDVLSPLERGGKAGLFGGAGVGNRLVRTDQSHARGSCWHSGVPGYGRRYRGQQLSDMQLS